MNTKFIIFTLLLTLLGSVSFGAEGSEGGGGGDGTEIRINDIRADILQWIANGGAQGLMLPAQVVYKDYIKEMTRFLQPHAVIIGSVTTEQEKNATDPEQKVIVNGEFKSCRGFVSKKDKLPHVLCNKERFEAESESLRYALVHHEYAGLAGLEKNLGASSDYAISKQLTDYLVSTNVLKLSVIKNPNAGTMPALGFAEGVYTGNFDCSFNIGHIPNQNVLLVSDAGCGGRVVNPLHLSKAYCEEDIASCMTLPIQNGNTIYTFQFVIMPSGKINMYFSIKYTDSTYATTSKYELALVKP